MGKAHPSPSLSSTKKAAGDVLCPRLDSSLLSYGCRKQVLIKNPVKTKTCTVAIK